MSLSILPARDFCGLGPGLLESAYEKCLEYELQQASLKVERQKPVRLKYKTALSLPLCVLP
ncbi:MAG: GxxExxY protein [Verrucomicrobia bacterium]|nr:GxxExxY protein [Verrucomicrobiota bacterium]